MNIILIFFRISKTLRFQGVRTTLQNATDEEIFDRLVDANDTILERTVKLFFLYFTIKQHDFETDFEVLFLPFYV